MTFNGTKKKDELTRELEVPINWLCLKNTAKNSIWQAEASFLNSDRIQTTEKAEVSEASGRWVCGLFGIIRRARVNAKLMHLRKHASSKTHERVHPVFTTRKREIALSSNRIF